jgi:hypothetical protein
VVFNDEKFTFTLVTAFGEKSVDVEVVAMEDRLSTRPIGWDWTGRPAAPGAAGGSGSLFTRLYRWIQSLGRKRK